MSKRKLPFSNWGLKKGTRSYYGGTIFHSELSPVLIFNFQMVSILANAFAFLRGAKRIFNSSRRLQTRLHPKNLTSSSMMLRTLVS